MRHISQARNRAAFKLGEGRLGTQLDIHSLAWTKARVMKRHGLVDRVALLIDELHRNGRIVDFRRSFVFHMERCDQSCGGDGALLHSGTYFRAMGVGQGSEGHGQQGQGKKSLHG